MKTAAILMMSVLCSSFVSAGVIDSEHKQRAQMVSSRAIEYLASRQHYVTGGWDDFPEEPHMPAFTALVLQGMLLDPTVDEKNGSVLLGIRYLLEQVNEDGSIHDGILPSYNTAISVSALSMIQNTEAMAASIKGIEFLRTLQYSNTNSTSFEGIEGPIDVTHPYFGGVGYGKHGRPDLSNLSFFVEALHDTGVSTNDAAYQRAQVFLSRVQMVDEVNEMDYADGSEQGGFIYATVPNLESVDGKAGQSQAGTIVETTEAGEELTRLQSYGSMTYAGFKSLVYADIDPEDPRMVSAWRWIEENYTLEENPGLGEQGYYYYLCTMARALDAFGVDEINGHNWREEMIDKIHELQFVNGAFKVLNKRWMEENDVLIAAYALIAIGHAAH